MLTVLLLIGGATAAELCVPSPAVVSSRLCDFGTIETWDVISAAMLEASGYSVAGCRDQCSCTPSPHSQTQRLLAAAALDPTIYNNNTVCSNPVLRRGGQYITAGYAANNIFAAAQVPYWRLCGTVNGQPCRGQCYSRLDVDTPMPACDYRTGPTPTITFVTCGLYMAVGIIFSHIPAITPPPSLGQVNIRS